MSKLEHAQRDCYRVPDAAAAIGITLKMLRNKLSRREIEHVKLFGDVFIPKRMVETLLKEGIRPAAKIWQ